MKLKIFENRYLLEDIAAVKKYYPSIDDATFMQLIALDPTYRDGSNSLGKYGKWILNLYNKGAISEEDFSEISPLLQQFTTYRNRIQNIRLMLNGGSVDCPKCRLGTLYAIEDGREITTGDLFDNMLMRNYVSHILGW